ncbi:MAG: trigger factor [Actinobacteria bacterium]|nr:trigger factor [Actinomycetota bacterium]
MKVLKSKKQKNNVYLEIEITNEEFDSSCEKAFKKVVKDAKVPGFRQGKVTRSIFEKHYGKEMIIQEGIQIAVNQGYFEAIQELDLPVIDYPKDINIDEYKPNAPIKFTCNVEIKPEVKLGKYKGIKIKVETKKVNEDDFNTQLDQFKENIAKYEPSTDEIGKDDIIRIDINSEINGTPVSDWNRENTGLKVGIGLYGDDFDTAIMGLKTDQEKSFSVTYPEDYKTETVANQTVQFFIKINEVRKKVLPELTDEMVSSVSEHNSVQALKDSIQESLEKDLESQNEGLIQNELIKTIISNAKFELPEVMVNNDVEQQVNYMKQTLQNAKIPMDKYLQMMGKSEDEYRSELAEQAKQKIEMELIIDEIVKKENPDVSEEEMIQEIRKMDPKIDSDDAAKEKIQTLNQSALTQHVQKAKVLNLIKDEAKVTKI